MFRKKRSLGIRVWHWSNSLTVFLLLLTVLLRRTFHNVRANTSLIKANLEASGAVVTAQQARSLARVIKDSFWDVHEYLGYFLAALIVFRAVVFFFDRRKAQPDASIRASFHYLAVKWTHRAFYFALATMIVTGLALSFDDSLGLSKSVNHLINFVHENTMWLVLAFIVLHICGVGRAEQGEDKGLVSEMIHGG